MDDELYQYDPRKIIECELRKSLAYSNQNIENLNKEISKIKQQNIYLKNNIVELKIDKNKLEKHLENLNKELDTKTFIIKNYKLKILENENAMYNNNSTIYEVYIKEQYNKFIYDKELENAQLRAELIDLKKQ